MPEHERIAQRLDTIYARLAQMDTEQTFLIAQLANYYCILLSAYLERAIVEIVRAYCEQRAALPVVTFVSHQLTRFQNPLSDRVARLVGGFGEPIKSRFDEMFKDEFQTAVDSVVNNRNNLAHGRNATVTFSMLRDWDVKLRALVTALKTVVFV